ncbi:LytR/AlgR family response regulator transcription factor [Saccharicrinis fermentans]|uniref:Response regulator of the LytR/AlgR family protein n=1 Tax=Saccharicrinis fermentans DSM 9555 = JCM 21142 TaxID=869213 RepID=W7YAX0_9BACT|nr:LytTR family DNA-binding domain-containing protein [Saccharicrinis fermentans]GAF05542.1 response regulator of the LytR/AlgR family protein [Saccharicrinis fermentans DSM 9555 = JCM 21142]
MRIIHMNDLSSATVPLMHPMLYENKRRYRLRLLVNKGNSFIIVPIQEVAYFHISGDILYAVGFNNSEYHIDSNMKTLVDELDPAMFFRINRQYTVNIDSIERFEPYFNGKLVVKTIPRSDKKMIVSKIKAKSFKEWIDR